MQNDKPAAIIDFDICNVHGQLLNKTWEFRKGYTLKNVGLWYQLTEFVVGYWIFFWNLKASLLSFVITILGFDFMHPGKPGILKMPFLEKGENKLFILILCRPMQHSDLRDYISDTTRSFRRMHTWRLTRFISVFISLQLLYQQNCSKWAVSVETLRVVTERERGWPERHLCVENASAVENTDTCIIIFFIPDFLFVSLLNNAVNNFIEPHEGWS